MQKDLDPLAKTGNDCPMVDGTLYYYEWKLRQSWVAPLQGQEGAEKGQCIHKVSSTLTASQSR